MKKINKRYFSFVFASLMSVLMSAIISLFITVYEFGFVDDILWKFLSAWQFALPVAFFAAHLVSPIVRKITQKLVEA